MFAVPRLEKLIEFVEQQFVTWPHRPCFANGIRCFLLGFAWIVSKDRRSVFKRDC